MEFEPQAYSRSPHQNGVQVTVAPMVAVDLLLFLSETSSQTSVRDCLTARLSFDCLHLNSLTAALADHSMVCHLNNGVLITSNTLYA